MIFAMLFPRPPRKRPLRNHNCTSPSATPFAHQRITETTVNVRATDGGVTGPHAFRRRWPAAIRSRVGSYRGLGSRSMLGSWSMVALFGVVNRSLGRELTRGLYLRGKHFYPIKHLGMLSDGSGSLREEKLARVKAVRHAWYSFHRFWYQPTPLRINIIVSDV